MKKLMAVLAAGAAIVAVPALADVFDFTVSGPVAGMGTLTATQQSGDEYLITAIAGTFDGSAITGLSTFAGADNLLFYPTDPHLDFDGFSFTTAANTGGINIYYNSSAGSYRYFPSGGDIVSANFTLTEETQAGGVPEPTSWAMMLSGFGIVGAALRRRATTVRYVSAI